METNKQLPYGIPVEEKIVQEIVDEIMEELLSKVQIFGYQKYIDELMLTRMKRNDEAVVIQSVKEELLHSLADKDFGELVIEDDQIRGGKIVKGSIRLLVQVPSRDKIKNIIISRLKREHRDE